MRSRHWAGPAALTLALAACGSDGGRESADAEENAAAANAAGGNATAEAGGDRADMPACPFRRTRDWVGSVERGHVRVNGYVDVTMAGFRPTLTERPGAAPGTLALDLALAPAPNEPINDHARYERTGAPAYPRAEIWCGGERIETIDMTVVQ
jgi:hypothetical protein